MFSYEVFKRLCLATADVTSLKKTLPVCTSMDKFAVLSVPPRKPLTLLKHRNQLSEFRCKYNSHSCSEGCDEQVSGRLLQTCY